MSTDPHITVSATLSLGCYTGETLSAVAVSPSIIILHPPEKLVLEITPFGRYFFLTWSRNGIAFGANGFENTVSRGIVDFGDTYYSDSTTEEDLAEYEVSLNPAPGSGQAIPNRITFTVIAPGTTISIADNNAQNGMYFLQMMPLPV